MNRRFYYGVNIRGMNATEEKIVSLDELAVIAERLRSQGKSVALCHGVFDLLHPGHFKHFEAAKKMADALFVTLTRDAFVNKGPGRPAFPEMLRAETVASVQCVDYVALNDPSSNALPVIEKIHPDVYVKGSEYADMQGGVTGNRQLEKQTVEAYGGRVAFTDEITFSSTNLLNQFFNIYPEEAQNYLKEFRSRYRPEDIIAVLEKLRGMRVMVIGDAVIDEYHHAYPLGKSGKENLVVSKYLHDEAFAGGVFALANHVAGFCDSVSLVSILGAADSREQFIRSHLKPNVNPTFFYRADTVTTIKRRFVDATFLNKLYEIYYFDDSPLSESVERDIRQYLIQEVSQYDCVIVLDYMHGFLSPNLINLISSNARFLAVNTQTNAANTGFNLITKYPRADYVCISEPELRLALHDRHGALEMLMRRASEQISAKRVVATRGPRGSMGYTPEGGFYVTPVLSQKVLDRVGAGDAYLGITAPAVASGVPMDVVGFLGGVAGAIAVTIVGNKSSIEYKDVVRAIKSMLL